MNKKDKYHGMEDYMETNQGMGMYPYMGMSMQPMTPNCPAMMPMNYPMMAEGMMPSMAMQPMMSMQSMMGMNPIMMGMGMQPMMMDENMQDETYMNYMINMNKYMSHMYMAEAYKIEAMEYMKKMEK